MDKCSLCGELLPFYNLKGLCDICNDVKWDAEQEVNEASIMKEGE